VSPDTSHTLQVLLVDDNPTNLQVLFQTLDRQGYRLLAARSGKDAVSIAQRAAPDLILLDVMMPEMDGFETCARLKADVRTREAAVIFLSAVTEPAEKVRGLELGAVDFINKPFQAEEVIARVRTHLTVRQLQKHLADRNQELEHELSVAQELLREARDRHDGVLLGSSLAAVRLRREVQDAAQNDEPLLVNGPPGSDHEAVARAIHHQSRRGSRAIICIHCLSAAVDVDLTAKLLLADAGTLYLEGIQHLSHGAQKGLAERLRAMEDDRRAGLMLHPDVRLIASTTRELDEEVLAGRLVPDLRRRLRRALDIAPLRSRLDDLPTLAEHIVRRQAEQAGRTMPILTADAVQRLKTYSWPGNIRELATCSVARWRQARER